MILNTEHPPRRAGIYFIYDSEGIIDRYIPYMLNDLAQNLSFLLIVVNGILSSNGRNILSAITPNIFVRDNLGFDVWAYKEGLEYIGWDHLKEYDEIVMMNNTIFGPIYPFKETFDAMNSRDVDFWGLAKHHGYKSKPLLYEKCKYNYVPAYIYSCFITVRKSLFLNSDFRQYWDNMPMIQSYEESVSYHESIFTKDFEDKGYKSDVYVNTDDLELYHPSLLMHYPLELIKNRRFPVFRRKLFFNFYNEFLDASCGQSAWELYNYLKNETSYDVEMIWENILRTANMYDIKNRMQLNYILPTAIKLPSKQSAKTALFIHLYDLSMMDILKKYAGNMPNNADIIISTSSEEKKEKIIQAFSTIICHELRVIVIPNVGRDVSALLIGLKPYAKDYDYICFIHDKQAKHIMPLIQGQSFAYKCYENILSSKEFVENVIKTFHENPHLGLLMPPPPNHGIYYYIVANGWTSNFLKVKELADKLGLQVDIDSEKPPIAPLGTCFWFRPKALQLLFDYNYTYDDFPSEPLMQMDGTILHAIERVYMFVAQNEGYYSGWLISDIFAKFEITNLYEQLRDCYQTLIKNFKKHRNRHDLLNCVNNYTNEKRKLQERIDALLAYVTKLEDTVRQRDGRVDALLAYVAQSENTVRQRDERIDALLAYVAQLEDAVKQRDV